MIFPILHLSNKRKEILNNDLAVLPSYNKKCGRQECHMEENRGQEVVRFDSRKEILLWGLGLNSELCLLLHLLLLGLKEIY